MVSNGSVCGEKASIVARRFEPPHRSLTLPGWLVRFLRSIVQAFVLAVLHAGQHLLFGCPIATECIGDQHAWYVLTAFQQLPKKRLRGCFVPPALEKDIEHVPMRINCPPQRVELAISFEENLVEMPRIAGLRPSPAQLVGVVLAELPTPLANRFIAQQDAARSHELFHITIPEREPKGEPHGMADTLDRKAMALIGGGRYCIHAPMIPQPQVLEPAGWLT